MGMHIETKDCTGLGDAEMSEMADMGVDRGPRYDVGVLSKACDEWVLITQVRDGQKLAGYSFSTLERIGGTPSVLIGLGSVRRSPRREAALKALIGDQLRRAVLAFPDEDVLVGARFMEAGGFTAFRGLQDVVPRPGHKASGEERAWGRRLAKRFGAEGRVDDRTFLIQGTGDPPLVLDHESLKPEAVDAEVVALFEGLDEKRGDSLVAFGWAMAEDLAARAS